MYIVFKSFTGKVFIKDTRKARVLRMRKVIFAWCEVAERMRKDKGLKAAMITLTYDTKGTLGNPSSWDVDHIRYFIMQLKKRKSLRLYAHAWVLELQANGTPHYHVIVLYEGVLPYPDQSKLWVHGMSNVTFRLRTMFYIAKYVGKEYQKNYSALKKKARVFGAGMFLQPYRNDWRVMCLSDGEREVYNLVGWDGLREAKAAVPSWAKAKFLGSAVTREYAEFIADDVSGEA